MSSEITNVSRLVSLSGPNNKQNDLKGSSIATASEPPIAGVPNEGLKVQVAESKSDAKEISLEAVKSAASKGNSIFQASNRNLEFHVDDSTKKVVVKIVDSNSGDVIQQIPTEDMLALIKRMQEFDGKHGTMLQGKA